MRNRSTLSQRLPCLGGKLGQGRSRYNNKVATAPYFNKYSAYPYSSQKPNKYKFKRKNWINFRDPKYEYRREDPRYKPKIFPPPEKSQKIYRYFPNYSYDPNLDPKFDPIEDEKRCKRDFDRYHFINSQTNKFRQHSNPFCDVKMVEKSSFDQSFSNLPATCVLKNNKNKISHAENCDIKKAICDISGKNDKSKSEKTTFRALKTKKSPQPSKSCASISISEIKPIPQDVITSASSNVRCDTSVVVERQTKNKSKLVVSPNKLERFNTVQDSLNQEKSQNKIRMEPNYDEIVVLESEIVTLPDNLISGSENILSDTPVKRKKPKTKKKKQPQKAVISPSSLAPPLAQENNDAETVSLPLTQTHTHTPPQTQTLTHTVSLEATKFPPRVATPKIRAETDTYVPPKLICDEKDLNDRNKETKGVNKKIDREDYKDKILKEVREYFSPPLDCSMSVAQVAHEVMKVRVASLLTPPKDKKKTPIQSKPHSIFGQPSKNTSISLKPKVVEKNQKIFHKVCQVRSFNVKVREPSSFLNKVVDFIRTYLTMTALLSLFISTPKNVIEGQRFLKLTSLAKDLNLRSKYRTKINSLKLKRSKVNINKIDLLTTSLPHKKLNPLYMGHEIKNVSSNFKNQLFTPVTLGKNGYDTHIQLDSGATVNLIDRKMAEEIIARDLINYVHINQQTELVDVQQNVIKQSHKPINVTCYFNGVPVNICFHVVENLGRPLLGLSTMLNANMSIINNDNHSFLLIGSLSNPQAMIENYKIMEDEILLLDNQKLEYGINKVSCYSALENGEVEISPSSDFSNTCLFIPQQSVQIKNHKVNLQVYNLADQSVKLTEKTSIGTFSALNKAHEELFNDQVKLKNNNKNLNLNEEKERTSVDDDRFSFPLSEEEGKKLLDSCEPANLPIIEGNNEVYIDWEKELSKPGIFPAHRLEEFKIFLKTQTPGVFSRTEYDVGCLDKRFGIIESFPLTSEEPVYSKPYIFNAVRQSQINNTFDKLERNGLVKKGHSPYATPCLLVPKGDGRIRLVIDFRKLNAQCETSNQPVPRIDTLMQMIADAKPVIFSTCDISNAFHSLQLGEKAMYQASIVTPTCQYLPTRLIFGYKNSPALFLQALQKVFMELPKDDDNVPYCTFYFDDIVIFSKNEKDHMRHLKNVITLLHKVGLKIQSTKNHFFQEKIELLGKVITGTTISPQRKHIESLEKFPIPSNIKQLQSLLGLVCWSHALIPDYSQTIQPLTKLLRKDEPFFWGPDQQKTFEYLKEVLTERTVLYFSDHSKPYYLAADASDRFIAGMLYQIKSYSKDEIPALIESLKSTKELHKLPPPKHPTVHPLLPRGALGIPSPFKLTTEGINSPHNPINTNSLNENIELEFEECLDSTDKLHVVCNVGYYSSSLSKSQAAYSIIEKEALAVVSSLEFFKPQLQGANKVYVLSDSRPFLYIMKLMRCGISRLQRWSIRLFSLPYEIIMCHIKGTMNVADSLTRVWAVEDDIDEKPDMKEAILVTSPFKIGQLITYDDLLEALEKQPSLVSYKIKEKVKSKQKTNSSSPVNIKNVQLNYVGTSIVSELEKMISIAEIANEQLKDDFCKNIPKLTRKDEYYQFQNVWYKKRKDQTNFENSDGRIVVPRSLVSPVIALFHMENHSGVTNICSHINSVYFFPHMFKTVREFLNMCHLCAVYKASTAPRTPVNLREIEPSPKNAIWSLDVVEGMTSYKNTGSYLSIVEYFTGYRIIVPLLYSTAKEVAQIIERQIISTFGPPMLMISDGGTNLLKSKKVKELLTFYGIQTHITTPYHPASHGRIEVSHQAITNLLKMSSDSLKKPWFELCSFVQLALNCRPSTTLGGKTPMYFMFGTDNSYRRRKNLKLSDVPDVKEQEEIWRLHDKACKEILRNYNRIRNNNNEKLGGKMVFYKPGDFVWAKNFVPAPKMKMRTRYLTEPLEVLKDYGRAILAKNHLGVIYKLHKDNVKKYNAENIELYLALPLRTRIKLGAQFNEKDLQNYYNLVNNEVDEPISAEDKSSEEKEMPTTDETNSSGNSVIYDDDEDDEDLEDEDDDILPSSEKAGKIPSDLSVRRKNPLEPLIRIFRPKSNQDNSSKSSVKNPKKPDQPLHMRLRNRIKDAFKPKSRLETIKEVPEIVNRPKKVRFNDEVQTRYF